MKEPKIIPTTDKYHSKNQFMKKLEYRKDNKVPVIMPEVNGFYADRKYWEEISQKEEK